MGSEQEPGWLMQHGADAIRDTVRRWSGVEVPISRWNRSSGELPAGPSLVLCTAGFLDTLPVGTVALDSVLRRVPFLNEQGFACASVMIGTNPTVCLVGQTPRGVYNGAQYLRDFRVDGSKENLRLACEPVVRTPQLAGRAAYTLTIWGLEDRYTASDWETIFDSFARDGFDRIYFWVSGHFPSEKFPHAYKCRDLITTDSTEHSRIATLQDLRRLVRAAHDRGLKFYAGGGLGGWCCTYLLTKSEPGTTKTACPGSGYRGENSLCPSHPKSRQALIEYYKEVFDGLPEADGLFIESADEYGACCCPACSRKVDARGSTAFGTAQLTLIQEMMRAIWRDHPHARLAYTIGYAEHRKDPAYYELIQQMSDPRFEWMEARDSWAFPGPEGQDLPMSCFSRQILRFWPYDLYPLDQLVRDARRIAESGQYGLITEFVPGADTGSFHTQIPFPTDKLPYVLTGFVWREATWEPTMTSAAMRERVQQRFFGREARPELSTDLWELRELIREVAKTRKMLPQTQETLARIDEHIQAARSGAGPKTAETLGLMEEGVAEIRAQVKKGVVVIEDR